MDLPTAWARKRSWPGAHLFYRMFVVLGALIVLEIVASKLLYGDMHSAISRLAGNQRPLRGVSGGPAAVNGSSNSTREEIVRYFALPSPHKSQNDLSSKAVVASRLAEENVKTDWIEGWAGTHGWQSFVYIVDDPDAPLTVPQNKGREASVYLTYVIDHYDELPDVVVFVHGPRFQWHNDDPMFDTLPAIAHLNLHHVMSSGYVSLRCTHWPGCPAWLRPRVNHTDPECWWPGCEATLVDTPTHQAPFPLIEGAFADAFQELFPGEEVPALVGAPCCAQFAVSRATVRARTVDEYRHIREWIYGKEDWTTFKLGAVFEHFWHLIFKQPAVSCDLTCKECKCERFGLCDLDCPNSGECNGQYWRPKGTFHLPSGWPFNEEEYGWPPFGWWNSTQLVKQQMWDRAKYDKYHGHTADP